MLTTLTPKFHSVLTHAHTTRIQTIFPTAHAQSVAGGNDLEVLEDVEIIFSPVYEIANLNRCVNLRSLTLIGVGLRRLSNLACVARSLERLCLPENEITRIEGLYLPNLRELYLHSNQICRIEGLDGCPKLQRLWLTDNRIVKLENLHALGDLRELWLQGNRISRVQNLEPLANLESLHLANNRIADFKDLHRLSHLPNLRDLSLVDADHGSNPVVRADGYRQFVLCTLKTVRVLDSEAVTVSLLDFAFAFVFFVVRFSPFFVDVTLRGNLWE